MRKLFSAMSAAALAAAMAVTGVAPVNAAPFSAPTVNSGEARGIVDVQNRAQIEFGSGRYWRRGGVRPDRNWGGRRNWDNGPRYGYYNGHRGYRSWRRGYRERNGWWYPAGAFVAGAIIGSAINNGGPRYSRDSSSAHTRWCYNRYRSYRDWDNTFQPYNGPRQQCYSPYS